MSKPATDHFHHYTFGETDEPDVTEQVKPIYEDIYALTRDVRELQKEIEELKRQLSALDTAAS